MREGLAIVAVVLMSGCTDALPMQRGVCGNGVIEIDSEDCDFAVPEDLGGGRCGEPGDGTRACHILCDGDDDCPDAWRCAADGACVHHSGRFDSATVIETRLRTFALGHVDDDEQLDVAGLRDGELEARFGNDGEFDEVALRPVDWTAGLETAALRDADDDGTLEVAVPTSGGVVMFTGDASREVGFRPLLLASSGFSTDARGNFDAWSLVVELPVKAIELNPTRGLCQGLVILETREKHPGLHAALMDIPRKEYGDYQTSVVDLEICATGPRNECAGTRAVVLPRRLAAPSDEGGSVFLTPPGADHALLVRTRIDAIGRLYADGLPIPLPDGSSIASGSRPLTFDADGDGESDELYVTTQDRSGALQVVRIVLSAEGQALPAEVDPRLGAGTACPSVPLALGDLNRDGLADFVLKDRICLTMRDGLAPSKIRKEPAWVEAEVADFDDDGSPDIAGAQAGSSLDLFYSRDTTRDGDVIWDDDIKTLTGAPTFLRAANFDGMGPSDLSFVEAGALPFMSVVYGEVGHFPDDPVRIGTLRPGPDTSDTLRHVEPAPICDGSGVRDGADDLIVVRKLGGQFNHLPIRGSVRRAMYSPLGLARTAVMHQAVSALMGRAPDEVTDADPASWLFSVAWGGDTSFVYSTTGALDEGRTVDFYFRRYGGLVCGDPPRDRFVWALGSAAGFPKKEVAWGIEAQAACGSDKRAPRTRIMTVTPQEDAPQYRPTVEEHWVELEPAPTHEALARDFDGDGDVDLVIARDDAAFVVWGSHDESGAWQLDSTTSLLENTGGARSLAMIQADADAPEELVVVSGEGLTFWSFDSRQAVSTASHPFDGGELVRVGDVDADGVQDLAVSDGERIRVLHGVPHRTVGPPR